jgi:hypothetical protein
VKSCSRIDKMQWRDRGAALSPAVGVVHGLLLDEGQEADLHLDASEIILDVVIRAGSNTCGGPEAAPAAEGFSHCVRKVSHLNETRVVPRRGSRPTRAGHFDLGT